MPRPMTSCQNCGQQLPEDVRYCAVCGMRQRGQEERRARPVDASLTSPNQYVRALRRFWWLLLLGTSIAVVAAVASVYRLDFSSIPPDVQKRAQVTYTASARLLVTSSDAPYFRRTVYTRVTNADGSLGEPGFATGPPDLGTLISNANLYPLLIESDEVQALRQKMHGLIPGSITAHAIYAVASPNRFELSEVPVIEVFAFSGSYSAAVDLAQSTVEAFTAYVEREQDQADLAPEERILIRELERPNAAVASQDSSRTLPLMLFVAILAAFVALAVVLNRIYPSELPRLHRRGGNARARVPAGPADETSVSVPERPVETGGGSAERASGVVSARAVDGDTGSGAKLPERSAGGSDEGALLGAPTRRVSADAGSENGAPVDEPVRFVETVGSSGVGPAGVPARAVNASASTEEKAPPRSAGSSDVGTSVSAPAPAPDRASPEWGTTADSPGRAAEAAVRSDDKPSEESDASADGEVPGEPPVNAEKSAGSSEEQTPARRRTRTRASRKRTAAGTKRQKPATRRSEPTRVEESADPAPAEPEKAEPESESGPAN
jgi:hypothetical protein